MKLTCEQLSVYLAKNHLAAIYLITGEEPLQLTEAVDRLRAQAKSEGFNERVVLVVDAHFDWSCLMREVNALSLFSSKRLLEVRLDDKSPGTQGGEALLRYANQPPSDTILLITAGKISGSVQKSKWFSALASRGVIVTANMPTAKEMPNWIERRLKQLGMRADHEAIQLLAERAEGHLAAAVQEIEKLQLLYHQTVISAAQVLEVVADSARFEIFGWIDTILAGETERIVRQLQRLREEAVEPFQIVSLLSREIESLCCIALQVKSGQTAQQLAGNYRFWGARKALAVQAVHRHSPQYWMSIVQQTVRLDKLCKGAAKGNIWDELQQIALAISGVKLPLSEPHSLPPRAIPTSE